jgi:hypothetical protein
MKESIFLPIDKQKLSEQLAAISYQDFIAVIFTTGDTLLGSLFKHWEYDENQVSLSLSFNTIEGRLHGNSCIVDVPMDLISDVSLIPLSAECTPQQPQTLLEHLKEFLGDASIADFDTRLSAMDYPNPIASLVYNHNQPVISQYNLEIGNYVEKALSQTAIPTGGFDFDPKREFLLYTDWEFFAAQARGDTSISATLLGVVGLNKNIKPAMDEQVLQLLRKSWNAKIAPKKISPAVGRYTTFQACILVPDPLQTEIIEGAECNLYRLATETGESYAVLLKYNLLKYPASFLKPLKSLLTFYGENLPMPVSIGGTSFEEVVLARAIAHLAK